jgi:NADPH:quinone reductase-like Zn-dependent oxidoreductase
MAPIAVTRHTAKQDDLLAAGAATVIATDHADVAEAVRRHTGGAGAALRPAIDKIFTLDDIAETHRHLEKGSHAGKIVVTA